jgi:hypothetical protein
VRQFECVANDQSNFVMYVDIINKDFQELVVPIFKNLYHNSKEGASSILQSKWHDVPFIKARFGDDQNLLDVIRSHWNLQKP